MRRGSLCGWVLAVLPLLLLLPVGACEEVLEEPPTVEESPPAIVPGDWESTPKWDKVEICYSFASSLTDAPGAKPKCEGLSRDMRAVCEMANILGEIESAHFRIYSTCMECGPDKVYYSEEQGLACR